MPYERVLRDRADEGFERAAALCAAYLSESTLPLIDSYGTCGACLSLNLREQPADV